MSDCKRITRWPRMVKMSFSPVVSSLSDDSVGNGRISPNESGATLRPNIGVCACYNSFTALRLLGASASIPRQPTLGHRV